MMALVEKPNPRRKLMLAGGLDGLIILAGVAMFVSTGNIVWVIGTVVLGAVISVPLLLSGLRELKERQDASR